MLLYGNTEPTIDAKGRLAIPAKIRTQWDPQRDGGAWFAMPWIGGVIRLYTEAQFQRLAEPALSGTLTPSADQAALQQMLFSHAERLEMDAAGRVRLPEAMLELTGVGREVALIGCGDRLEIHDRSAWRERSSTGHASLPELLERVLRTGD